MLCAGSNVSLCAEDTTANAAVPRMIGASEDLSKYPGINKFIKIIHEYDNQQENEKRKEFVEVSSSKLTVGGKYIQKSLGTSPINDVTSVIRTLPGVISKGDLDAHLYVRGGSSYELTTVIDDQVSYAPFFWDGKVNMINPKLVESISFYSGGFPAKYGRLMSGVLDIKQITGDTEKTHFELDQNLTELNYLMHGPIKLGESSWLFSARKTYYDMILDYLYPSKVVVPGFTAYYAKFFIKLSPNHKFYLSQQNYSDIMRVEDSNLYMEPGADYRNTYSRLQYLAKLESTWVDNVSSRVSAGWENYSLYHYYKNQEQYTESVQKRTPIFFSTDLSFQGQQHSFEMGAYASREKVTQVEDMRLSPDPDYSQSVSIDTKVDYSYRYYYAGVYLQDDITLLPHEFALNFGVRYCMLPGATYLKARAFQPRAILYIGDKDNTVFTLSAGKYAIFNNPVFNGVMLDVDPEQAIHISAGLQQSMDSSSLWRAEVFYKDYFSLVREVHDSSTGVITGYDNRKQGQASGVELMWQKKETDNWGAALSYTLSSIQYKDPDHDWYFADHDQTHTFNLSGSYHFGPEWKMLGNLYAASGRPFTDITAATFEPSRNIWVPLKSALNGSRQPAVCKIDLSVEYSRPIWPFDRFQGSVYLGLSNILNIHNIYRYYWNHDYSIRNDLAMLPLMPVFGVKVVF